MKLGIVLHVIQFRKRRGTVFLVLNRPVVKMGKMEVVELTVENRVVNLRIADEVIVSYPQARNHNGKVGHCC